MRLVRLAMLLCIAVIGCGRDPSYPHDLPKIDPPPASLTRLPRSPRVGGIATHQPSLLDLDRARPIEVCDLIRHPADFDDQLLRVHGISYQTVEGLVLTGPTCAREPAVCLTFLDSQGPRRSNRRFPYGGREAFDRLSDIRAPEVEVIVTGEFQDTGECVWTFRSFFVVFRVEEAKPYLVSRR